MHNFFGENLSGLYFEPPAIGKPAILWAIENYPSTLYRLIWNGTLWLPDQTLNWENGKRLHYFDGSGSPDAEDITKGGLFSDKIYICSERNDHDEVPKNMVILYTLENDDASPSLNGTMAWDLTADLPTVSSSNKGLEAITWISDDYLLSNGFIDENNGLLYQPDSYPNHGNGLILVGLEDNGMVYVYALDHVDATYKRVAKFSSGFSSIMALSFDEKNGYLWCVCDDNCDGVHHIFTISSKGKFSQIAAYARPLSMGGNYNSEGFTVSDSLACIDGFKSVLWSDDSEDAGHAIRHDKIPCGRFINYTSPDGFNNNNGDDDWKWEDRFALDLIFIIVGGTVWLTGLVVIVRSYCGDRKSVNNLPMSATRKSTTGAEIESGTRGGILQNTISTSTPQSVLQKQHCEFEMEMTVGINPMRAAKK